MLCMQALAALQLAPSSVDKLDAASDGPPDTWHLRYLRRSLGGSGFHRDLNVKVVLEQAILPPAARTPESEADTNTAASRRETTGTNTAPYVAVATELEEHADAVGGGCRLAVVQPLPAAVYVDVDQLAALQAAGAPFEAHLFGESRIGIVSNPALTRCLVIALRMPPIIARMVPLGDMGNDPFVVTTSHRFCRAARCGAH